MILGIWDGHDSGAAIIENNEIKVAINEERLTRKKLDVNFPERSIMACLNYLGLKPSDIEYVAVSTSDLAKTITRLLPDIKREYYLIRRRKIYSPFIEQKKLFKYVITKFGSSLISKSISNLVLKRYLKKLGFENYKLYLVEHHAAHAATAAFASGFNKSTVVTIDGIGDGISGTVNIFENGELRRIEALPPESSLGVFFEHVTNLLGMRELEDEGKVMALADFAYPLRENPLLKFFYVDGSKIKGKLSWVRLYKELKRISWLVPREEFAWMAQNALEHVLTDFFRNVIKGTGIHNVAWSGGVASNIKANMKIRLLPEVKDWFIFPHMGDGGLALGAAMWLNYAINGITRYKFENVYFGLDYTDEEIEKELRSSKMRYERVDDPAKVAADLILKNKIVFWFQGRMEYGPRALGNRSVLARSDSLDVKNRLNLRIKKRVWYQPFCPSVLDEDSRRIFEDFDKPDRFMTMGYMVKDKMVKQMRAVVNIDRSARPQMVGSENNLYRKLLRRVKKKFGIGSVLNTSFNIHGEPVVCSPRDAVKTMKKTKNEYMIIGKYLVYGD